MRVGNAVRIVVILKANVCVDPLAVAKSIEHEPSMSKFCYRAARLWHRLRRTGRQTQVVENWGSILEHLWKPHVGMSSGGVISRPILKVSGYTCDGACDHVCEAVCSQISGSSMLTERSRRSGVNKGVSSGEIAARKMYSVIVPVATGVQRLAKGI